MPTTRLLSDDELSPEARAVFDDIRATRGSDFVNNVWRALAFDPPLLARTWAQVKAVMGTPGALDPLTRDRLQQSFLRIRQRLSLTAIFVTHDMVEALLVGDRIAVMHGGKLVQVGTPSELLQSPADDYVRQLMSTPRRQAELVEGLLAQRPS